MDSESNHQHDADSSQSLIDETIVRTLTSPSLPTLPFDLIPEILCRLPVKLFVQFRCVCKSWNSLISEPKFTKKHLQLSTASLIQTLTYFSDKYVLKSYPLHNHEVKVHTLGPIYWKNIQNIPFGCVALQLVGKLVSGTINWLFAKKYDYNIQIVSLDLENESYKQVLLPKEVDASTSDFRLGLLMECLYMVIDHDVWVMKEHGNKDSWTKLFTISYKRDLPRSYANIKVVVHVFQGVLLKSIEGGTSKLIFYNFRNGTYKFTQFEYTYDVCVESLISPCS